MWGFLINKNNFGNDNILNIHLMYKINIMLKNVDLPDWVITELQELADASKRPLKLHMEFILENAAKKNMAAKRKSRKKVKS